MKGKKLECIWWKAEICSDKAIVRNLQTYLFLNGWKLCKIHCIECLKIQLRKRNCESEHADPWSTAVALKSKHLNSPTYSLQLTKKLLSNCLFFSPHCSVTRKKEELSLCLFIKLNIVTVVFMM